MYDYSPPGGREQRIFLCGREYFHSLYIEKYFNPGQRILLAGNQVDPFFLNYYLYPIRLYYYDSRALSPDEINKSYVKKWMSQKKLEYILVYTPFNESFCQVLMFQDRKNGTY